MLDQSSEFLKQLTEEGIEIGTVGDVVGANQQHIQLQLEQEAVITLTHEMAGRILVNMAEAS